MKFFHIGFVLNVADFPSQIGGLLDKSRIGERNGCHVLENIC